MKKNRDRKNEIRVPFPTILVVFLTLSVVIGAGCMSLNIKCSGLGKKIKFQEKELVEIQKRLMIEEDKWSRKTSPINLNRALTFHKLDMKMPESHKIIRVELWKDSTRTVAVNQHQIF